MPSDSREQTRGGIGARLARVGRRLVTGLLAGAVVSALAAGSGCGREPAPTGASGDPVRVVVSIPPLAGLIRGLVPEEAEITVLVPPGRTAHGVELTPSDVSAVG